MDAKPVAGASPPSRLLALALTLGSAVIVVTCGTGSEQAPPPAVPAPAVSTSASASTASAPADSAPASSAASADPSTAPGAPPPSTLAAAESASAPPLDALPPRGEGHELDRFYAALRGLEKKTRAEHVRVAWLGDSHGAADFWSGTVRTALQQRFGSGGVGFVNVGSKSYRHDAVTMDVKGKWKITPKGPSTTLPTADGVFGLSGMLFTGVDDNPRATLTITESPSLPGLSWDLCYRLKTASDEILVKLPGMKDRTLRATADEPPGAIRHVRLTGSGDPALTVVPQAGFPELCGVVAEADPKAQPGVVLDTLGINGARLATPLAWNEASWVGELSRRAPALVILEYGTNESGDHTIKAERYLDHLHRVMARVHKASPACDCLVLAPTDRSNTTERTPKVRDALKAAAKAEGCGFWDTYEVMGGKGSILQWHADKPSRAAGDGVHLNARGYHELGEKLGKAILDGYTP
ncbi:MAG: GDSL-type esterase/lipase family protein [Byssovorax sp.]